MENLKRRTSVVLAHRVCITDTDHLSRFTVIANSSGSFLSSRSRVDQRPTSSAIRGGPLSLSQILLFEPQGFFHLTIDHSDHRYRMFISSIHKLSPVQSQSLASSRFGFFILKPGVARYGCHGRPPIIGLVRPEDDV